jgi:hypothetical protein
MATTDREKIETFVKEMLDTWNDGDREGFLDIYRRLSPNGFSIEMRVGQPVAGFEALEQLADGYIGKVKVENLKLIINGNEAAAVMRNAGEFDGRQDVHESIEIYQFGDGTMHVRYFTPDA